jgi:hypothetical protein
MYEMVELSQIIFQVALAWHGASPFLYLQKNLVVCKQVKAMFGVWWKELGEII